VLSTDYYCRLAAWPTAAKSEKKKDQLLQHAPGLVEELK